MAEQGINMFAAQPISGIGQANAKTVFVPAGVNYINFLANNSLSPLSVSSGALGDWLAGVLVTPSSTTVGQIWIQDGPSSAFSALILSAGTLSDIKPFYIPIGARSVNGSWRLSTSAGVANVMALGAF
jgi:hypothetical protein